MIVFFVRGRGNPAILKKGDIMDDFNEAMKVITIVVVCIVVLSIISFTLWSVFAPKRAEVERKVFEQSKSYVHGKIQDLSKWYLECKEDPEKIPVMKNMIQAQFSDFDASTIDSVAIRQFLIEMRGY